MPDAFARFDAFPHWSLAEWEPEFPPGRLDRIYLHWSGWDDDIVHASYHYCIARDGERLYVVHTNDLRANMRNVAEPGAPYAAHTARRNSYAAGLSVMGMRDATPHDFGAYPLRDDAIDALCAVAKRIADAYAIPADAEHVMTHAEAALIDGYFGAGADDVRWDIARLIPRPEPLAPNDARTTGDELRRRIIGWAEPSDAGRRSHQSITEST
jgi:hypothetical protein